MNREFLDALTGDPSAVDDYLTHTTTTKTTAPAPAPVARTTTNAPTGAGSLDHQKGISHDA